MPRTKKKGRHGRAWKPNDGWTDRSDVLEMTNEKFEKYYKAQNIVPEDEWESFLNALRQPLPSTFRIAANRQMASAINDVIKNSYVPQLQNSTFEGELLPIPTVIPWYPKGYAWQVDMPRKSLRRSSEYKKFHKFLVFETEVGNISRQEAASMIPPLFLDVKPHHWVMDMCAAPGSKTAQLVEFLHANDSLDNFTTPTGLIIANDSDRKRAGILIHQSSRLPSPALMVTNLDASIYPTLKIPDAVLSNADNLGIQGRKHWRKDSQQQVRFDRILCDVPCSGDGTVRKNPAIWRTWQPLEGNGLHSLQLRILQRGMNMLKNDGIIVYSTCSHNPVENEAVVAAALNADSNFELVDVSTHLPELIRRPGLNTWRVTVDRDINMDHNTFLDYQLSLNGESKNKSKILPTFWPPSNAQELSLERCLRIYSHLQDTGGFFIAVLRRRQKSQLTTAVPSSKGETSTFIDNKRLAEESSPPEAKKARVENDEIESNDILVDNSSLQALDVSTPSAFESEGVITSENHVRVPPTGKGGFKEEPFTLISSEDLVVQSCLKRLDLKSTFPSSNLLVRNSTGEPVRTLYLVNDVVKAIIQTMDYSRIRLMSAGCKVFNRAEMSKGMIADDDVQPFRVLGEGLLALLPYIKRETLIGADLSALKILLESYHPLCTVFSGSFRSAIDARSLGSHIVCFGAGDVEGAHLTHDLILPLWKSGASISLMIDKVSKSALSLRLFGEDITAAAKLQQNLPVEEQQKDDNIDEADIDVDLLEEQAV